MGDRGDALCSDGDQLYGPPGALGRVSAVAPGFRHDRAGLLAGGHHLSTGVRHRVRLVGLSVVGGRNAAWPRARQMVAGGVPFRVGRGRTWELAGSGESGGGMVSGQPARAGSGHAGRMGIATFNEIESLATLLFVALDRRAILRALVLVSAVAVGMLGVSAIKGILEARHFEGFVMLIGSALIAQSLLTIGVVVRARKEKTL